MITLGWNRSAHAAATELRASLVVTARIIVIAALCCLVQLASSPRAAAQQTGSRCANSSPELPKYRIVRRQQFDLAPGLTLFVSVDPKDVSEAKFVALVCALGEANADQDSLVIFICDSVHAAKRYNPQGEGNDRETIRGYRGDGGFSREPGPLFGQTMDWKPEPLGSMAHVDLGPPPAYRAAIPEASDMDRAVAFALRSQIYADRLTERKDVCLSFAERSGLNVNAILATVRRNAPKVHDDAWCNNGPRGVRVATEGDVNEISPGVFVMAAQTADLGPARAGESDFGSLVSRGTYTVKCEKGEAPVLVSFQKLCCDESK